MYFEHMSLSDEAHAFLSSQLQETRREWEAAEYGKNEAVYFGYLRICTSKISMRVCRKAFVRRNGVSNALDIYDCS